MSFLTSVQQSIPFLKRRKSTLPREEMLSLRPVRNPVVIWESPELNAGLVPEENGTTEGDSPPAEDNSRPKPAIVLTVPRRDVKWSRWLARVLDVPTGKRIELDEFGGEIWLLCDGANTVEQLVKFTCSTYKLNRRQGEISVVAFMRMLAQRHLVGFLAKENGVVHDNAKSVQSSRPKRSKRQSHAVRRN